MKLLLILLLIFPAIAFGRTQNFDADKYNFGPDSKFIGKITAESTANGFHPCPSMTDTQMLAIASPAAGDCVYNSTLDTWLVYKSVTSLWEEVGGGGGIGDWVTATDYEVGDVVVQSLTIYRANTSHTSSAAFVTDIAKWDILGFKSPSSSTDNGVPRFDGTSGKIIQTSLATIDDAGALSIVGVISTGDITMSSTSNTASLSGLQITNNNILSGSGANLSLEASSGNAIINKSKTQYNSTNAHQSTNDTATGANQPLTAPTKKYVRLTAAGTLTSIDTVPAGNGFQELVVVNATGAQITVNDETGATAADRILTGISAPVIIPINGVFELAYDQTSTRWRLKSRTGGLSLKGQNQTAVNIAELQVPNNLTTLTAPGKYLHETGNTNILVNPSFEHSTVATGWTSTTVTPTASTSTMVDGKQSLCFTASSQAFTLRQDSTLYQAAFANGFPGLATVSVKTNHTGAITFCSANAGTVSTTNCQTITANDQWFPYQLPVNLGGTSNGISISAASGSGTTCIDFAKVEVGLTKADTFNSTPFTTYTGSGTWSTNTTYSTKWRRVGSLMNIQAKVSLTGAPTGSFTLNLPSGYTIDTSKSPDTALIQFIGTCLDNDTGTNTYSCDIKYNTTTSVALSVNAAGGTWSTSSDGVTATVPYTHGNTDYIVLDFFVPITGWADTNTNYTAACGAACVDTFAADFNASGTTSNEDGGDWINGNATYSSSRFTVPFNSGIFTVAPKCWAQVVNGSPGYTADIHTEATTSQVLIYTGQSTSAAASVFKLYCRKSGVDLIGTKTIVGSFKDVVTSVGSGNSTSAGSDVQFVLFGTSTNCASACTTGTCSICRQYGNKITSVTFSSTGVYRANGIDGTKYNCFGSGLSATAYQAILSDIGASTSSYATVDSGNTSGANIGRASLFCIGVP